MTRRLGFFGGVGLICFVALIVARQVQDSAWVPRGSDWDSWYLSALWWGHEVPYPGNRWPFYGAVTALVPPVGPLHLRGALVSMAAMALVAASLGQLLRRLAGPAAGVATAALTLLWPFSAELANWLSGYPLWAACGIGGAVALGEAVTQRRRALWAWAGLGAAGYLATMGSGLAGGAFLLGFGGLCALGQGAGRRISALVAFFGPVALLGYATAFFPEPLTSFDKQIVMPEEAGVDSVRVDAAVAIPEAELAQGYVFGQRMGPQTLARTLSLARTMTADPARVAARRTRSLGILREAFPALYAGHLRWMAAGVGLCGLGLLGTALLSGARRRRAIGTLVGLLGVLGVAASVLPALDSNLNLRFLAPALVVVPALLMLPLAALLGPLPGLRHATLLAVPLSLWPPTALAPSPFLGHAALHPFVLGGGADLDATISYALAQGYADAIVDVHDPMRGGIFAIESSGGSFLDPQRPLAGQADPRHHVLFWLRGVEAHQLRLGQPADGLEALSADEGARGRVVLEAWNLRTPPFGSVVLLSPNVEAVR